MENDMKKESEIQSKASKLEFEGKISRQTSIQMDFEDGTTVVAPEGFSFNKSTLGDVGDIIDIACKITGWCGGGGGGSGGGGSGCYTIILPDGTKITICPPPKTAIA
jgi:hypothetical protein